MQEQEPERYCIYLRRSRAGLYVGISKQREGRWAEHRRKHGPLTYFSILMDDIETKALAEWHEWRIIYLMKKRGFQLLNKRKVKGPPPMPGPRC